MQYARPNSIDDAIAQLATAPATILAGGTDVFPLEAARKAWGQAGVSAIIDISAIAALRGVTVSPGEVRIGSLTTWTDIAEARLPPALRGLQFAAREVGGRQIQNRGTIGGNLCNASPAADGVPPLLTLDARIELVGPRGMRRLPVAEFLRGNRVTARASDEIMTAIIVPDHGPMARSAFQKLGARRYLVISIVMAAARLQLASDGTIAAAAVAVGACSAVALRLPRLEAALAGRSIGSPFWTAATADHLTDLDPIDDVRSDRTYRMEAALHVVQRTLAAVVSNHAVEASA